MRIKIGDTILLIDEDHDHNQKFNPDFMPQRAKIIGVDYESETIAFDVLKMDREEGDVDGLGEAGFEGFYVLKTVDPTGHYK